MKQRHTTKGKSMNKKIENEKERDKSHLTAASSQQKSIHFRTVDDEDESQTRKRMHAQLHATTWIVDNAFCVVSFGCFWCSDYGGGAATVTNCVATRVRSNLSIFSILEGCERFRCGDNINQHRHCSTTHPNERHVSEQRALSRPELDITS